MTWIERGPWYRYQDRENRVVIQTRFGVDGLWRTIAHRATVDEAVEYIERKRMPSAYLNDRETVEPLTVVGSAIARADLCD